MKCRDDLTDSGTASSMQILLAVVVVAVVERVEAKSYNSNRSNFDYERSSVTVMRKKGHNLFDAIADYSHPTVDDCHLYS